MEKVKRGVGGICLVFGALLTVSCLVAVGVILTGEGIDDRLLSAAFALGCAVISMGIFCLGYRLRHPKDKTQRPAPPAGKPPVRPPAPKKPSPQEQARRREEQEAREKLWREQQEARKRARMQFLEPWSGTDPDGAEHMAQWELALAGDCAMTTHYVVSGQGDEGLDGTHDGTGVDWFFLRAGSDLEKAVRLYAEIDTYRKACEAHGVHPKDTENKTLYWLLRNRHDRRFLLVSASQFHALGELTEPCLALCREHDLHVVNARAGDRYYDYVSGVTYEVVVGATFPGSADDAATYGELCLNVTNDVPEGEEVSRDGR